MEVWRAGQILRGSRDGCQADSMLGRRLETVEAIESPSNPKESILRFLGVASAPAGPMDRPLLLNVVCGGGGGLRAGTNRTPWHSRQQVQTCSPFS